MKTEEKEKPKAKQPGPMTLARIRNQVEGAQKMREACAKFLRSEAGTAIGTELPKTLRALSGKILRAKALAPEKVLGVEAEQI